MAKNRTEIPAEIAAQVLFNHDRTCCVCRTPAKPVQIHHIDEDPSNHNPENLAVLCFDCHRETQIRGGFDRKLNGDQIILYRDNWIEIVSQTRALTEATKLTDKPRSFEEATSLAEIYRENGQYKLLAMHYKNLPNPELRDKYIELALQKEPSDSDVIFLRYIQDRPDLIPDNVIQRELDRYEANEDWTQRARVFQHAGRPAEAAKDYVRGVTRSLSTDRYFSAAFYLKEMFEDGVIDDLFALALKDAANRDDLWWQVRAMQELGWHTEIDALLLEHADRIRKSGDKLLCKLLAQAEGDENTALNLKKSIAQSTRAYPDGTVGFSRNEPDSDETA